MTVSIFWPAVDVQRKCPPNWSAKMSDQAAGTQSGCCVRAAMVVRLTGGLSAKAYLLAVSLWMPSSRAIARRDRPLSLGSVDILVMMLVCQMLSCQQNSGTGFSISCVAAPACMSLRKKIASDLSRLCCGLTAPAPNGGCFRPNTGIGTVSINDSPVGLTKASGNRCFNISPATRTWNT